MAKSPSATPAVLGSLGSRIRELRRRRDLTQEQVAERLGMLTPNYARIEQGRQNVTVDTLVRVAAALETTVAELFRSSRSEPVKPGRPPRSRRRPKP